MFMIIAESLLHFVVVCVFQPMRTNLYVLSKFETKEDAILFEGESLAVSQLSAAPLNG